MADMWVAMTAETMVLKWDGLKAARKEMKAVVMLADHSVALRAVKMELMMAGRTVDPLAGRTVGLKDEPTVGETAVR